MFCRLHQTYLIESHIYSDISTNPKVDSLFLSQTIHNSSKSPTVNPAQNKALLVFLVWVSRAQIAGRDMMVFNHSACVVGCTECGNVTLGCASIFTAEWVGASHGYESLV